MATNEQLTAELAVAFGRINGLHAVLLTIARALPPDVAQAAADQLNASGERMHADALASPVPDVLADEQLRVIRQAFDVLRHAAQSR